MKKAAQRFLRDERGLETVEYAVMTALITAALILAIGTLTTAMTGRYGSLTSVVNGS
jgi:Flp pilus assembly pilin Flp